MKFLNAIVYGLCASVAAAEVQRTSTTMNADGQYLMKKKEAEWALMRKEGLNKELRSVMNQAQVCSGGSVSVGGTTFPCDKVDFESFLSLNDASIPGNGGTSAGSDIWGWLSPQGREITLWCVDNGIWFIDGTDPANPLRLGYMRSGKSKAAWCDVKVYKNVAYVVKDGNNSPNNYGVEVFDLTRLNGLGDNPSRSFQPDFVYGEHERSHNVAVDTESGFLYSVGTNTCSGGLHMINLEPNPLRPTFAGCVSSDGYTHDVQCVVYDGPDTEFTGRQICFAYNEDTLTIWDVTNKGSVTRLGRVGYPNRAYTHQGWLTEDMRYAIMNDELDEDRNNVARTTTYFFNVVNLRSPSLERVFSHPDVSPDHNLYLWGPIHKKGWGGNPPLSNPPSSKFAYLSNYAAGLRVLDVSSIDNIQQVGFFDVAPNFNGKQFEGTWSNYMHPSGVISVSSIDRGLFLLRPQMAFDDSTPAPVPTPPPNQTPPPTPFPTDPPTAPPTCFFFFC